MNAQTWCPCCEASVNYELTAMRAHPFSKVQCQECWAWFKPKRPKSSGNNDRQVRSKDQEKKAAKSFNARRQPASGSMKKAKGDFRSEGRIRGECKHTVAMSYSLKLTELIKLEKESRNLETPLFEVQFQGVHPFKTYVVLPEDSFKSLLDELEALKQSNPT